MSDLVWSIVKKNASYVKVNRPDGVQFSHKSLTGFNRQNASTAGRRRAFEVRKDGKVTKVVDGVATTHRYTGKRAKNIAFQAVRADQLNKLTKKVRFAKLYRSRVASGNTKKKSKNIKA